MPLPNIAITRFEDGRSPPRVVRLCGKALLAWSGVG
mgnify:CR=1 FL=1